jgi:hypothetical protein
MKQRYLILIFALLGLVAVGIGYTEEKPTEPKNDQVNPSPELQNKIEVLIKQLGNDDWKVREETQKELIKMGKPAIASLTQAYRETQDAEIKNRARIIRETILISYVEKYLPTLTKIVIPGKLEIKYVSPSQINNDLIEKYLDCFLFRGEPAFTLGKPPPEFILLGLDIKTERIFRINGNTLAPIDYVIDYLKKIKDKNEAREISGLITGLVGMCYSCEGIKILPKENFTVEEKDGFYITTGTYKGNWSETYQWEIKFESEKKTDDMLNPSSWSVKSLKIITGQHGHQ